MNLVASSLRAKGLAGFAKRIASILARFGINSAKMGACLDLYAHVLEEHRCRATFPVTATILRRHSKPIRRLLSANAELAIHGYAHNDYSRLTLQKQEAEARKAVAVFKSCEIPFFGFRCPYLNGNDQTNSALAELPFRYVSNTSIFWEAPDGLQFDGSAAASCRRALRLYQAQSASHCLSLPKRSGRLIEIPVSLPDDEILVDRLGLRGGEDIGGVWTRILDATYHRGELFTLQLHPERIAQCRSALEMVLTKAREKHPPVWIATLDEVAAWWEELAQFQIHVEQVVAECYEVRLDCSERATVLSRGWTYDDATRPWYGSYRRVHGRSFRLNSPSRPVVGLSPDSSPAAAPLLREKGYAVETSSHAASYACYLEPDGEITPQLEMQMVATIESCRRPLVRFGPWPDGARSALSVTGDIDAMTLVDFLLRLWEVR